MTQNLAPCPERLYNTEMDAKNLQFEFFDSYTLITPKALGPLELDHLPAFVEDLLLQKKQDVVMILGSIDTVFSSHLTAFVQVYRLLKSFNLRFIIVDISPAVLNVMQMTQLDSLLPLFLTLEDFRSAQQSQAKPEMKGRLDFSYVLTPVADGIVVKCLGYMAFGDQVRKLQSEISSKPKLTLDISEVGYMDTRVLIMISDLASKSTVEIQGASNVIRELFDQHRLQAKVKFVD